LTNAALPDCPYCHGIEIRRGEVITGVSYRPGAPLPRQPRPTIIMGAVRSARRMLRIKGDNTTGIILAALGASTSTHYRPVEHIEDFNDGGRKFDEIAGLLIHARNLAAIRQVLQRTRDIAFVGK
jgi:hypothetical protein